MGNNYDSMAGGLSAGKTLGLTAAIGSVVACSVWPELLMPIPAAKSGLILKNVEKYIDKIPGSSRTMRAPGQVGGYLGGLSGHASYADVATSVPVRLFLIITDTGVMCQACSSIHESSQSGRRFLDDLNHEHDSIGPHAWQANDQEAYSERLRKYRDSVVNTACLGEEAAMMTAIIATLRFIQHTISAILAGILGILAAAFWVAMAIPFGQAAAMAIRNAGSVIARILPRTVQIMDQSLVAAGLAHSIILGARVLQAGISDEMRLEDDGGLEDLLSASGLTLVDVVTKYSDKLKVWE